MTKKFTMTSALDTLSNFITGMGVGGRDKSEGREFVSSKLTQGVLENMYRSDWVSRKVVDIPAFDMTRRGRSWKLDHEQITSIENAERRYGLWNAVSQALAWRNLYGGSAIILNTGGNLAQPLVAEKVGKDGLISLPVVSRKRLLYQDLGADINDPLTYERPLMYQMSPKSGGIQIDIHPSRLVIFNGVHTHDSDDSDDFWGDSVLQAIYTEVRNAAAAPQSLAAMLDDLKTDIVAVKNLSSKLSQSTTRQQMLDRWQLFKLQKAINNVALIDAEDEEFETRTTAMTNYDAVVMLFLIIVSGAADIPATRMLGQSPNGLNATGESDLINYYDNIESKQNNLLRARLDMIDQVLVRSALGKWEDEFWYDFTPLKTPTAKEQAEIHKINAESVGLYVGNQSVNQAALAKGIEGLLVDTGFLPGFEQALVEFEKFDPKPEDLISALGDPQDGEEGDGQDKEDDGDQKDTPPKKDPPDDQKKGAAKVEDAFDVVIITTSDDLATIRNEPSPDAQSSQDALLLRDIAVVDVNDAAPRSLYVRRDVMNKEDIVEWAREQGLEMNVTPDDLHVTIAYSRRRVDWMRMPTFSEPNEVLVAEGTMPRLLEVFGTSLCLLFRNRELEWRHGQLVSYGASFDHEYYQAHITLVKDVLPDYDVSKFKPYTGKIVLGPEVWEEVKSDIDHGLVSV